MKYTRKDIRLKDDPVTSWDDFVIRPVANVITLLLANYIKISPNVVTISSLFLTFVSGLCFLRGTHSYDIWASALWLFSLVLDYVDGALGRLKGQTTFLGAFLDIIVDICSIFWIPFSIAYSYIFIRGIDGANAAFVLPSIAAFVFLHSLVIIMSLLKHKFISCRADDTRLKSSPGESYSPPIVLMKRVLHKYLTRQDARVLAFFVGPIFGCVRAGFLIADAILIMHFVASLSGALGKLNKLDKK